MGGKKILVVDDASVIRFVISDNLSKKGYECIHAFNGADAIKKAKSEQPDIILMDINMPHIDGITATRIILEYNKDIKIIMCSCLCDQYNVITAIKAGAIDFIAKPISIPRLFSAINQINRNVDYGSLTQKVV